MKKLLFLLTVCAWLQVEAQTIRQFKGRLNRVTLAGVFNTDGNSVVFDDAYSDLVDNYDVIKIANFGDNFGLLRFGQILVIEARRKTFVSDTIYYQMWNLSQVEYQLELVPDNMALPGVVAELRDNYLNTTIQVSLSATTKYNFTVNGSASSSDPNRFRVILKIPSLPVIFTSINARKEDKKIEVEWKVSQQEGIKSYEIQRSEDGRKFNTAALIVASTSAANISYKWLDSKPLTKINYYRIKTIELSGQTNFSSIVIVEMKDGKSDFIIVPNPVTNKHFDIKLLHQPPGNYLIQLFDEAAKLMLTKKYVHPNENSTLRIELANIANGVYNLQFVLPDKSIQSKNVVVANK